MVKKCICGPAATHIEYYEKIINLKPPKARRVYDGAAALLRQRGRGDHIRPQAGLGHVGGEAELFPKQYH